MPVWLGRSSWFFSNAETVFHREPQKNPTFEAVRQGCASPSRGGFRTGGREADTRGQSRRLPRRSVAAAKQLRRGRGSAGTAASTPGPAAVAPAPSHPAASGWEPAVQQLRGNTAPSSSSSCAAEPLTWLRLRLRRGVRVSS